MPFSECPHFNFCFVFYFIGLKRVSEKNVTWGPNDFFDILNVRPFSPGGFFTFLAALAHCVAAAYTMYVLVQYICPPQCYIHMSILNRSFLTTSRSLRRKLSPHCWCDALRRHAANQAYFLIMPKKCPICTQKH